MLRLFASVFAFVVAAGLGLAQDLEQRRPQPNKPNPQPGKSSWVNGPAHDGESITCDLPNSQQMKNIGSKLDNAGMCVFSAVEMAARYQGLEAMRGWRDWCAQNYRGGGYPEKVDKLLAAWWKHKGIPPIKYMQYQGRNPEDLLTVIDKTRRMGSITYGYSPRYGGYVAHMTNEILYGHKYAVVLDNNFVGDTNYEWMKREELVRRMRLTPNGGQDLAWIFVWITPGSPPAPRTSSPPLPRRA